jgi:hypothetical protein
MKNSIARTLTVAGAGVLIALGLAAPALAEGSRTSHMTRWADGDASKNWQDDNADRTNTHVTFDDCTREFKATIRRTVSLRPDPNAGSEWIDCRSYADAVYGGHLAKGKYHFDISGMGLAWCASGMCEPYRTSVRSLHIYW